MGFNREFKTAKMPAHHAGTRTGRVTRAVVGSRTAMLKFNRYVTCAHQPEFDLPMSQDLVFVGTMRDDNHDPIADVWTADEHTTLVLQGPGYPESSLPLAVTAMITTPSADNVWARATRFWADRVNAYKESAGELPPTEEVIFYGNVQVSYHHGAHTEDDGEGGYHLIFVTHDDLPVEVLTEYVRELHPMTYCQHEHDCCGRAYRSHASVKLHTPVMAIYEQHWHLNI